MRLQSAVRRFFRRCGYDRNPMRRRVDRVQTVVGAALTVLVLVLAPVATLLVAGRVHDDGVRAERQQHAARHRVVATVISTDGATADGTGHGISQTASVAFDYAGAHHVAVIPLLEEDRVGSARPIWVNGAGRVVVHPRDHAQTLSDTTMAALLTVTGVVLPVVGCHLLIRRRLDRRRYAGWEADWVRTARLWIDHG